MLEYKSDRLDIERQRLICERAEVLGIGYERMKMMMDLDVVHSNGCPLDFGKLLESSSVDFAHDIAGIRNHLNRSTGELEDCFVPRCARDEEG